MFSEGEVNNLLYNDKINISLCSCYVLQISGFDAEDLVVDVGYWFKGSTNRKGYLRGL